MWNNSFIFALANFPAGYAVARAVLTAYDRPPDKSIALGPIYTQPFTTVNVDKIKHIFIVLVLPTKSVFKH